MASIGNQPHSTSRVRQTLAQPHTGMSNLIVGQGGSDQPAPNTHDSVTESTYPQGATLPAGNQGRPVRQAALSSHVSHGVHLEKVRSAKYSCSSYRSHITRSIGQLKQVMSGPHSEKELIAFFDRLESNHEKYHDAVKNLLALLGTSDQVESRLIVVEATAVRDEFLRYQAAVKGELRANNSEVPMSFHTPPANPKLPQQGFLGFENTTHGSMGQHQTLLTQAPLAHSMNTMQSPIGPRVPDSSPPLRNSPVSFGAGRRQEGEIGNPDGPLRNSPVSFGAGRRQVNVPHSLTYQPKTPMVNMQNTSNFLPQSVSTPISQTVHTESHDPVRTGSHGHSVQTGSLGHTVQTGSSEQSVQPASLSQSVPNGSHSQHGVSNVGQGSVNVNLPQSQGRLNYKMQHRYMSSPYPILPWVDESVKHLMV